MGKVKEFKSYRITDTVNGPLDESSYLILIEYFEKLHKSRRELGGRDGCTIK